MTSEQSLTDRVHALIFNGITAASAESDGFDSWLPLSERERFTRAVIDELRRGNIEFRLGPLALLAEVAATEAAKAGRLAAELDEPAADHHARLDAGTEPWRNPAHIPFCDGTCRKHPGANCPEQPVAGLGLDHGHEHAPGTPPHSHGQRRQP